MDALTLSRTRESWEVGLGRVFLSAAVLLIAALGSLAVAFLNAPWFDLVNGVVGADDPIGRGLLFSTWPLLVGGLVVVWRPAAFGFRLGLVRSQLRFLGVALALVAGATVLVLRATGSTPYSDASLFIEAVDVPFTEELVFRAVLLTALVAALGRIHGPRLGIQLAVLFNGIAFGLAHLANLTAVASAFVVGQAVFAIALGWVCAYLMVRTRSVYPAMVAHGVVNALVVVV